jgi:hypothetical protein
MSITNSSMVVPHNLIQQYKHALLDKGFKVFISKSKNNTQTLYIYMKKKKNTHTQIERN